VTVVGETGGLSIRQAPTSTYSGRKCGLRGIAPETKMGHSVSLSAGGPVFTNTPDQRARPFGPWRSDDGTESVDRALCLDCVFFFFFFFFFALAGQIVDFLRGPKIASPRQKRHFTDGGFPQTNARGGCGLTAVNEALIGSLGRPWTPTARFTGLCASTLGIQSTTDVLFCVTSPLRRGAKYYPLGRLNIGIRRPGAKARRRVPLSCSPAFTRPKPKKCRRLAFKPPSARADPQV